jgi:predicted phage tail protein
MHSTDATTLRTVRVYGPLAKFLGRRTFRAAISTAAEAIRFLLANFPALERHMADQRYRISSDAYDLDPDTELHHPIGFEVSIIPVIGGAGGSPIGRIALGVTLVAASLLLGPGGALAGKFFSGFILGPTAVKIGVGIGASLALGGVSQLLTPTPRLNQLGAQSDDDPRRSYSFTGIQQSSRQGVPIPIVYGWDVLIGSVVVSAGIDTVQVRG